MLVRGGDKGFVILKTIQPHHLLLPPLTLTVTVTTVRRNVRLLSSKRKDTVTETSTTTQQQQPVSPLIRLRVPNPILARSALAVFALGFIDAGYSGDWSRIGVISKEVEELLKIAAFLVVPLCIFIIFSLSKSKD